VGHIRGGVRLHRSVTGNLFRAQRHFARARRLFARARRLFAGACRHFDHARLQFAGARRHCGWGEGISHPTPLPPRPFKNSQREVYSPLTLALASI
jgi:hypothetical protein